MYRDLQPEIDSIIHSWRSDEEKIISLRDLFIWEKIEVFSDFDDTISSPESILYFRFKILQKLITWFDAWSLLVDNFILNPEYIPLLNSIKQDKNNIVIITGNDHSLSRILAHFLKPYNISIAWVIGKSKFLSFSKKQKPDFIPKGWILLWDVFEDPRVKVLHLFHLIKSKWKIWLCWVKLIALGAFLFQLLWQLLSFQKIENK